VFYAAAADLMPVGRVAFRSLAGLTAQTCLAVLPGPPAPALRRLLDACASVVPANPARTATDAHEPLMHGPG